MLHKPFHVKRHLHNHNVSFHKGNIIPSIIVVTNHHETRHCQDIQYQFMNGYKIQNCFSLVENNFRQVTQV